MTTIDLPPAGATTQSDISSPERSAARARILREILDGAAALADRQRCAAARRVHHSGISLGHLQILWILQEHGPLPVSRLAEMLGIGAPNATGLLDRMEQRGLVERARDVDDRRVVLVRQTHLGRETVAEMDGWRADVIEAVLSPLTLAELEAVAAGVRGALESDALASSGPSGTGDGGCTGDDAPGTGALDR